MLLAPEKKARSPPFLSPYEPSNIFSLRERHDGGMEPDLVNKECVGVIRTLNHKLLPW